MGYQPLTFSNISQMPFRFMALETLLRHFFGIWTFLSMGGLVAVFQALCTLSTGKTPTEKCRTVYISQRPEPLISTDDGCRLYVDLTSSFNLIAYICL